MRYPSEKMEKENKYFEKNSSSRSFPITSFATNACTAKRQRSGTSVFDFSLIGVEKERLPSRGGHSRCLRSLRFAGATWKRTWFSCEAITKINTTLLQESGVQQMGNRRAVPPTYVEIFSRMRDIIASSAVVVEYLVEGHS